MRHLARLGLFFGLVLSACEADDTDGTATGGGRGGAVVTSGPGATTTTIVMTIPSSTRSIRQGGGGEVCAAPMTMCEGEGECCDGYVCGETSLGTAPHTQTRMQSMPPRSPAIGARQGRSRGARCRSASPSRNRIALLIGPRRPPRRFAVGAVFHPRLLGRFLQQRSRARRVRHATRYKRSRPLALVDRSRTSRLGTWLRSLRLLGAATDMTRD